MSAEAPKEEQVPVVEAATEAPAATEETAPEVTTEAPAAEAAPAAAEETAAAPAEVKPVEEGVLGYKGPGLLKGIIFQKKFFFFGTDAVESKHLSSYLRGEKPDVANKNAAWASHTGKGLLFFTKKASEKANPAGIINLSEISDIKTEGSAIFFFTVAGHKHSFEAANAAERDGWVASLKTKEAEAKELATTVTETEAYKKAHSALSKPVLATAAAAAPKKSTEAKAEDKPEAKEDKPEEPKEEKKEEKARKSRSASRKRTSIFGSIPGFGKKEDKAEVKEEAAVAAEAPAEAAPEPVAETAAEPAAEPVVEAEPAATTEEAAPAEANPKPAAVKRNSIFGTIKSQFSSKDKKPEVEAPAVPAKDTEPVAETAPVIPAVESTEPLAASEAAVEIPATNGETAAPETPVTKNEKRKSSLPWLSKKEKPVTSDDEAEKEKPLSPFAKLRATVKGSKSPKVEKPAEKPTEEPAAETAATDAPAAEATPAAVEEPVAAEPIPAATAQVSATA